MAAMGDDWGFDMVPPVIRRAYPGSPPVPARRRGARKPASRHAQACRFCWDVGDWLASTPASVCQGESEPGPLRVAVGEAAVSAGFPAALRGAAVSLYRLTHSRRYVYAGHCYRHRVVVARALLDGLARPARKRVRRP